MSGIFISPIISAQQTIEARNLLKDYGHYMYDELGLLAGKNSFYKSLENFPTTEYDSPHGDFALAYLDDQPAGCIGLKKFDTFSCEMKRMFVSPKYRGKGLGKQLIDYSIYKASELGYLSILLDTNAEMAEAVNSYRKYGFYEIPKYCENENSNVIYMRYDLV